MTLDATLAECSDLRYTPAGIPALECVLKHASVQPEAGGNRKVDCEIAAVAFGEPAIALARVPKGTALRCIPTIRNLPLVFLGSLFQSKCHLVFRWHFVLQLQG